MNIVLLTQLCWFFFMCRMFFVVVFEFFTLFNTFLVQYLVRNMFDTSKEVNVIELKWLYSFIFKVYGPKYIEVLDSDEFQFQIKVQELKTYLTQ